MADQTYDDLGQHGAGGAAGGEVIPLTQMTDYEIADGYPDIRGWEVKDSTGKRVGEVHELLVDPSAMRVRYLDIGLDREFGAGAGDRHVLIPIGSVALDDQRDDVVLRGIGVGQLAGLAPYNHSDVTREYETDVLSGLGFAGADRATDADFYTGQHFDDSRLFSGRRTAARRTEGEAQVTRAEEELAVGKRQVQAGEVGVRKTVETERVREQVPITREEVEIERRPVEAGADVGRVDVREDEIRVPLMAEEVVAEKRVVPKEQLIIRKRPVTRQQTVEADVRKERIEVDDSTRRASGTARRSDQEARP
jgi:uncharacterized protein (TIGR02271 family)